MRRHILFVITYVVLLNISTGCKDKDSLPELFILDQVSPDSIFVENSAYIAVIGDIQEYTNSNELLYYLVQTNNWLRWQQEYFGVFSCVLQNGDLTEYNSKEQWSRVDFSLNYLGNDLIFIPSTGNHDYTWGSKENPVEIADRNTTKLNSLKNLKYLRNLNLVYFEKNKLDNIIVPIEIGNRIVNIISLEFGPRKEVIEWVSQIVKNNKSQKYILMTHEWLTLDGERIDSCGFADLQFPRLSHTNPEEIWQKLVFPNDNILCVLCGHNGFCKYLFSENKFGRNVGQILFNLQYQENGGDGMIQLWEFPNDKNEINISVYNTITRQFHPDPTTRITIKL